MLVLQSQYTPREATVWFLAQKYRSEKIEKKPHQAPGHRLCAETTCGHIYMKATKQPWSPWWHLRELPHIQHFLWQNTHTHTHTQNSRLFQKWAKHLRPTTIFPGSTGSPHWAVPPQPASYFSPDAALLLITNVSSPSPYTKESHLQHSCLTACFFSLGF